MESKYYPQSRQNALVIQELKGELLVYDLNASKAYCLNEISAFVWQLCDGNNSVKKISQSISKNLKSAVTEDFVWLAIAQLEERNLLAGNEEIAVDFKGRSRREVIRKIGLGSLIALPVISSLAVPTAANAASNTACIAEGQPCVISDDCCPSGGFQNCQEDCFTGEKVCVSGVTFCP